MLKRKYSAAVKWRSWKAVMIDCVGGLTVCVQLERNSLAGFKRNDIHNAIIFYCFYMKWVLPVLYADCSMKYALVPLWWNKNTHSVVLKTDNECINICSILLSKQRTQFFIYTHMDTMKLSVIMSPQAIILDLYLNIVLAPFGQAHSQWGPAANNQQLLGVESPLRPPVVKNTSGLRTETNGTPAMGCLSPPSAFLQIAPPTKHLTPLSNKPRQIFECQDQFVKCLFGLKECLYRQNSILFTEPRTWHAHDL